MAEPELEDTIRDAARAAWHRYLDSLTDGRRLQGITRFEEEAGS